MKNPNTDRLTFKFSETKEEQIAILDEIREQFMKKPSMLAMQDWFIPAKDQECGTTFCLAGRAVYNQMAKMPEYQGSSSAELEWVLEAENLDFLKHGMNLLPDFHHIFFVGNLWVWVWLNLRVYAHPDEELFLVKWEDLDIPKPLIHGCYSSDHKIQRLREKSESFWMGNKGDIYPLFEYPTKEDVSDYLLKLVGSYIRLTQPNVHKLSFFN